MIIQTQATNIITEKKDLNIEIDTPPLCIHCSCNYNPRILESCYIPFSQNPDYGNLFILYFCSACNESFLVKYRANYLDEISYQSYGEQITIYPFPSNQMNFQKNIVTLSQGFVKIYNEAFLAEQQGLTEICGIGYRKSLEFLIKDYAIFLNPSCKEAIKPMPLSQCINSYVDNNKIKILAKASSWIGNDETHYVRKHKEHDLESLKSFIHATVSFIDSDIEIYKAKNLLDKEKN